MIRKSLLAVLAVALVCVGCAKATAEPTETLLQQEDDGMAEEESTTIVLFGEEADTENETETVTVIYEDTVLPSDAPDAKVNGKEVESTVSSVPTNLPDSPDAAWEMQSGN